MKKLLFAVLAVSTLAFSACDDDEVKKRDITVEFVSAQIGLDATDQSATIDVTLNRAPETAMTAKVTLETENVEYGTHFTTVPAAVDGVISLSLPTGETTGTITINKVAGVFLDGNEGVKFTISELSVTEGTKIGEKNVCELTFGSIVSEGGKMTLLGNTEGAEATGEAVYPYSVYVDLSGNKQNSVDRKSWNIGFWCGEGFHVVLNSAYTTVAAATDKTDMSAVTLEYADAFETNLNTAGAMGNDATAPSSACDSFDGKLATTVFGEVSATDADNKVFFVASAAQKTDSRGDWFKVRVTRKDGGYHVEYSKVNGGTVKTIDIAKKEDYNLVFLSLEDDKTVDAEPMGTKWDIRWSYDYGIVAMGGNTYYMFTQDVVSVNNLGGVKAATVMVTESLTYDSFVKADITGLTFDDDRSTIGTGWRATAGMGGSGGVTTDRFYVIQDPAGYYYKLRFERVGISSDGGIRGRPEIAYKLVE